MSKRKEERRGGARDDTDIYINYSIEELVDLFMNIKRKYEPGGVSTSNKKDK